MRRAVSAWIALNIFIRRSGRICFKRIKSPELSRMARGKMTFWRESFRRERLIALTACPRSRQMPLTETRLLPGTSTDNPRK